MVVVATMSAAVPAGMTAAMATSMPTTVTAGMAATVKAAAMAAGMTTAVKATAMTATPAMKADTAAPAEPAMPAIAAPIPTRSAPGVVVPAPVMAAIDIQLDGLSRRQPDSVIDAVIPRGLNRRIGGNRKHQQGAGGEKGRNKFAHGDVVRDSGVPAPAVIITSRHYCSEAFYNGRRAAVFSRFAAVAASISANGRSTSLME
jgi:hypothetical protein